MNDNNLYDFLIRLSKQRNVKLGGLAEQCYLSRTTLYRYMKGILQIPPHVESALSDALSMSDAERERMRRLIADTSQDGSLLSSRNVLDNIVFSSDAPYIQHADVYFAFHNKDSYLRGSHELAEIILKHSEQEMFRCEVKVMQCIEEDFKDNLQSVLMFLLSSSDAVEVEHLLDFPRKDYLTCTKNLIAIIPLLDFLKYNVFYNDSPDICSKASFFTNCVLVETSWLEGGNSMKRFFIMTYLSGILSQCTSFEDEYLFRFFMENYQNHRSNYKTSLKGARSVPDLSESFMGLEFETEFVVMKPKPCYPKIPAHVYVSLLQRVPAEDKRRMNVDTQEGAERTKFVHEMRFNNAYKTGNIDVMSKSGLLSFVKEGFLIDHIEGLPPFDKSERKEILQSLREHMAEKSSGYQLYITDKDFELRCVAYKNNCLVIEQSRARSLENCISNKHTFVLIENKILASTFVDYATHHIPAYHAMPEAEALRFLDELIAFLD